MGIKFPLNSFEIKLNENRSSLNIDKLYMLSEKDINLGLKLLLSVLLLFAKGRVK